MDDDKVFYPIRRDTRSNSPPVAEHPPHPENPDTRSNSPPVAEHPPQPENPDAISNSTPCSATPPPATNHDTSSEYINIITLIKREPKSREAYISLKDLISDVCEPDGLMLGSDYKVILTSEEKGDVQIADFVPIVIEVVEEHTVEKITHLYTMLILSTDEPPQTIRIDAAKADRRNWIDDLGPQYIIRDGSLKAIRTMLQRMSKYAPRSIIYAYNGWLVNGEDTYIMADQQISASDWNKESSKDSCSYALSMLDVAPRTLTISLLAIALLSLTHSRQILTGDYFKGVCCIEAQTQSFKTTLASLFFDFLKGREADTNFEATITAIVRAIGNCRDSVTIVDDYKPGASRAESRDMVKKISTIIRMASDDSGGIQKAGAKNTTVSNTAHGLVVVTAEYINLEVQSSLARLLILELNKKEVDLDKLTYFQEHFDRYLSFVRDYIAYIASKSVDTFCDELARQFRKERHTLRRGLDDKDVSVDNRTSDMCTWLWIIFLNFLDYALCVEALDGDRYAVLSEEAHSVFTGLMVRQAERVTVLDPVNQFFRGLQVLYDAKEVVISNLEARKADYHASNAEDAIGFRDNNVVYLKNNIAYQAVVAYYRRNGIDYKLSESSLRKALADRGYIIRKEDKRLVHRKMVNHKSYQCIAFQRETFYQLIEGDFNGKIYDDSISTYWILRANADHFLG